MLKSLARPLANALVDAKTRIENRIDPPVVVLLYHRVANLPEDPDLLAVAPERFREQMRWLKNRFAFTRFEADWSKLERPAIAITFDDGYADNFHTALPILAELDIPATFFITSGQLDSGEEFWWDELAQLMSREEGLAAPLELSFMTITHRFDTSTGMARQKAYAHLHRLLFDAPVDARRSILIALRKWNDSTGTARQSHRALSSAELARLAGNSLVTIGAHTVNHPRLAVLGIEAQRSEITASKTELEARLRRPVEVFAYPYGGRRDYTADTTAICREVGFRKAASNFAGNAHRWSDPLQVPRHLVRNWNMDEFAKRVDRFFVR